MKEVTCKAQELHIEEFERNVHKKVIEYIKEYHREPNYLKIPLWLYHLLTRNFYEKCYIDKEENLTYKNLKLCKTVSISEMEEMEVF